MENSSPIFRGSASASPRPLLSIFIPAFNAGKTLAEVVNRIPNDLWADIGIVAVINDGSVDDTEFIAKKIKEKYPKVICHSFPKNKGYGAAVRRGLGYCRESGSQFSVCLHADGQYPPEKLVTFISHMQRHRIDLLQGSRHLAGTAKQGGMPFYKRLAGQLLCQLENYCFGLNLTDYHSGYLVYGQKAIHSIPFEKLSGYFDFDLEVIASACALNLKIEELPIPTRYADEKSYLNPLRYGFKVLSVLWRYRRGYYRFS